MAKGKVSSMTKWSDAEKLKVLFSILDHSGPTKWAEVYIPPGRSVKAVQCMLDITRKQIELSEGDSTDIIPVIPTKKTKTATKAKPKTAAKEVAKAAIGTKRKRGVCEPEEYNAQEDREEDQNSSSLKRIRNEMEETSAHKEDTEDSEDNPDKEN